jgi:hypothetical protein
MMKSPALDCSAAKARRPLRLISNHTKPDDAPTRSSTSDISPVFRCGLASPGDIVTASGIVDR